jgi:hypothetical protein
MIFTALAQMWLPKEQWLEYWTSEEAGNGQPSA